MDKIGLDGDYKHITRNFNGYKLPYNSYSKTPIKLIPNDILLNLPVADDIDTIVEEMTTFNSNLRGMINRDIGDIWHETTKSERKSVLLKELKSNKEFFVETLKTLKEHKFEHYDLQKDYEGLYKWLENSQDFIKVELSKETKNCLDNFESLSFSVTALINHFRDTIENKEIWRTFWTKYGSEYRHVRVFYSQMLFFTVCNSWLTSQDSNIKINLKYSVKHINLEFTISGKNRFVIHIKHANNTSLEKGYKAMLEVCRDINDEKHIYLIMNFKDEPAKQLKEVRVIENPICKIFEIDVTRRELGEPDNLLELPNFELYENEFQLEGSFLEFEDMEFDYTANIEEKRKGGKARHRDTTIIKTKIVKVMFLHKKQENESSKVSEIANSIITELNSLDGHNDNSGKVQRFMSKYIISHYQHIQISIDYFQKHNDGGQISEWCY